MDYINHFHAVRLRVTGSGNLRMTLLSYNDTLASTLVPLVMSAATDILPTQLANVKKFTARLKVETTAINETFMISEIRVYTKSIYASLPQ